MAGRDSAVITSQSVTSKDGTRIAFDRYGSASTPIVLVSGALSDRRALTPLSEALAPHFSVYAYDRRGRGGSGDTTPYAVEREEEDLAAVIDEASGEADGAGVCVFGHSSGAGLALRAARDGVPITGLALYEPPYIVDNRRRAVPGNLALRLAELVQADRRADVVALWMTHTVQLPEEAIAGMRQSPMWPGLEAVAHTTVYDLAVMSDTMSGKPLPTEWADMVSVPTLVIVGGNSEPWIQNSTKALADLLPDARRFSLPGADHSADPAALAPVLSEFFNAS